MKTKLIMQICFAMLFLISNIANAQLGVNMLINGKPMILNVPFVACNDSCYNVTLSISGGTPPYTYHWNNGATASHINYCTTNLPEDTIQVIVTDVNSAQGYFMQRVQTRIDVNQSICIVTVDKATNKNKIIWEQSTDTIVKSYNIYKETSVTGSYALIGNVPKANLSVFIDTSSYPDKVSAQYYMTAKGVCAESSPTAVHKTMHLTINKGLNSSWNLIWENYEGISSIKNRIWRGSTSNGLQLIDSVSTSATTYTDLYPPVGVSYYAIEMISPSACNPTLKAKGASYSSSFSNTANDSLLLGINENQLLQNISISPNPAMDNVTIYNNSVSLNSIEIYNICGEKVFEIADNNSSALNHQSLTINLSSEPNGIYFIHLQTTKGILNKKLIIQH